MMPIISTHEHLNFFQFLLQEKEREKDRVKSSRTGTGVGLGSKVAVQTPIFVPPLPSDTLPNSRRSQMDSGNEDIGSSRQAQLTDRDRDSKWRHSDDCDAINRTQGEDAYGNQVEVEVDDQDVDSRGMDKGGDNGYLKQHMQHRKDKDPSSSTLLRRHSTNSRENENQDLDYEQDQTTVRSRASSLSVRSTGSKGRSSSAGKGGSSLVPFGGRSKALSNIQQVKNAINLVCLAGGHFDVQRAEAVRAIELCSTSDEDTSVTQVLVLVNNSKSLSFKALYAVHPIDGKYSTLMLMLYYFL